MSLQVVDGGRGYATTPADEEITFRLPKDGIEIQKLPFVMMNNGRLMSLYISREAWTAAVMDEEKALEIFKRTGKSMDSIDLGARRLKNLHDAFNAGIDRTDKRKLWKGLDFTVAVTDDGVTRVVPIKALCGPDPEDGGAGACLVLVLAHEESDRKWTIDEYKAECDRRNGPLTGEP